MKWTLVIVIILLILSLTPLVKAESGRILWVKSYGGRWYDVISDVRVLSDGSIIAVGWTNSAGTGGCDILVMKLSPNGKVLWAKTYGGSGNEVASAIALAENEDIIITGSITMRLDKSGDIKWAKNVEGSAVTIAPNGDIIVAGRTWSISTGSDDVWVLRLDENGNVKWQKTYGGNSYDIANAVTLAENGDIIVAGATKSFNTSKWNTWVLRLDGNGNVKWQKTYSSGNYNRAYAVIAAPNGDIILAGGTKSLDSAHINAWILRLDSDGNIKWQKTYEGNEGDEAFAITIAPNGDIIVAGRTWSFGNGGADVWLLRLDKNGNIKWQKTYGGKTWDGAHAVTIAPNKDIIVAGFTDSFGAGNTDIWILRLPPDGNLSGCKFCFNSNAQAVNTNAQVFSSNAEVTQSNISVKSLNVAVSIWSLMVKTQYINVKTSNISIYPETTSFEASFSQTHSQSTEEYSPTSVKIPSRIKTSYIIGVLVALIVLGGVTMKVRGRKSQ